MLGYHFHNMNKGQENEMSENVSSFTDSHKSDTVENETQQKLSGEPMIFALLGTDERKNEPSRSDTMILVRYEPDTKKVVMISIPRDSYVSIKGHGKTKINAAHAYGEVPLALDTLETLFNVKIDNYAKINFYGFMDVVDALGGINVNAKKTITWEDIRIEKGEQTLKGRDLLLYVRFRKDADGDFGRIERQQEVVQSAIKQFLQPSTLIKLPKIISIVKENMTTDVNWKKMLDLAWDAKDFDNITFETHTLQTQSKKMNGVWYELVDEQDLNRLSLLLQGQKETAGTP